MSPARGSPPSSDGVAGIGFGEVRHSRAEPQPNAFNYPVFFLWLPMRSLRDTASPVLHRNRGGALSFHDRDHGDGRDDSLQWLDEVLARHGVDDVTGEVWLLTFPRVLGFVFKPVSFWFCHRRDGRLRAVLAEVNNTFGERHFYLLDAPRYGVDCEAEKAFHVSPFCPVQGRYRFRFMATAGGSGPASPPRVVARIEYFTDAAQESPVLTTSISGAVSALNPATRWRAILGYPAMTALVVARIHWQAMKLWLKRLPFYRQPPAPPRQVTLVAGKSN